MQLQKYLKDNKIKSSKFASKLNVSRNTIWNWMSGSWYPSPRNMYKIEQVTDGQVTFIDMMRLYQIKKKGGVMVADEPEDEVSVVEDIPSAW